MVCHHLAKLVAISIVVIGICFYLILSSSKTFKVSHHPAKFGGQSHCSSGNIMVLVCHLI